MDAAIAELALQLAEEMTTGILWIYDVLEDSTGRIWLATPGGLAEVSGGHFRIVVPGGPTLIDHYVAVVGYDDACGRFLCENSYGPGWGDGGALCVDGVRGRCRSGDRHRGR